MHHSLFLASLFALTAAVSWGISNFLGAKAARSLGPVASSFLINTIGTILYSVVYLLFLHSNQHIDTTSFIYAASSGIVFTIGALAFFKALKIGPVSIVAPLSGTYPLVTTVLALLIFHAHLSLLQVISIFLITFGAMTVAELIGSNKRLHDIGSGPAWAVVTAAGWGTAYALLAQSIARSGWEIASLVELSFVVVGFLIFMPFTKGEEQFSIKQMAHATKNFYIISAGAIQLIGMLALNLAIANEGASGAVATAISSCYPAITMVLALRHLNEKMKLLPLVGAVISITGVVMLSLG